MGLGSAIKNNVKNNFNLKAWLGGDSIKRSSQTIRDFYNDLYKTAFDRDSKDRSQPLQSLSFEEAMKRNRLSEEGLKKRMQRSLMLLRLYSVLALLMLAYLIYLFMHAQTRAALFDVVLILVLASYMFKEHFNYVQMKQRRLGCTFKDWLNALVRGNGS